MNWKKNGDVAEAVGAPTTLTSGSEVVASALKVASKRVASPSGAAVAEQGSGKKAKAVDGDEWVYTTKKIIAAALKTKRAYSQTWTAACGLLEEINSQVCWEWARHDSTLRAFTTAQAQLKVSITSFGRQFLSQELADLKKSYDVSAFGSMCSKFSLDLDGKISGLQGELQTLLKMPAVRPK